MSNVNLIPTTKIAAGSTGVTGNAQALQGSQTSGVLAGAGTGMAANFWDMIIAQFTSTEAKAATPATTGITNNIPAFTTTDKKPVAQNDNPLAMLQIALAAQPVDAQGNIVLDTTVSPEKIQSKLDLTNQIIDHLKTMLPEGSTGKDGLLKTILSKLQAKSDTLQASLSVLSGGVITKDTPVEDIPLPMMIALGLDPSEISKVSAKIQALEEKLGREITVEDLIAGVGGLIPPSPENAVIVVKGTRDAQGNIIDSIDENSEPTDDLATQLNAMDVGSGDDDSETGLTNSVKDEAATPKKDSGLLLKDAPDVKADAAPVNVSVKKDNAAFKENFVNMLNSLKAQQGDMLFPATTFGAQTDAAIFQPYGMNGSPTLSFGTTAQAANMITSATVAGQAHPATQLVAAALAKSAKGGENSTINLRLDPPELGNVSIRLSFGKDKAVKAHITVEKPETFMMLQREGHMLERALQSAGLDTTTQGQAISFELAQDNSAFRHNNNGEGNDNFGGGSSGSQNAGAVDEIIQSSVTWQVDPSTGHVRYNIMA